MTLGRNPETQTRHARGFRRRKCHVKKLSFYLSQKSKAPSGAFYSASILTTLFKKRASLAYSAGSACPWFQKQHSFAAFLGLIEGIVGPFKNLFDFITSPSITAPPMELSLTFPPAIRRKRFIGDGATKTLPNKICHIVGDIRKNYKLLTAQTRDKVKAAMNLECVWKFFKTASHRVAIGVECAKMVTSSIRMPIVFAGLILVIILQVLQNSGGCKDRSRIGQSHRRQVQEWSAGVPEISSGGFACGHGPKVHSGHGHRI